MAERSGGPKTKLEAVYAPAKGTIDNLWSSLVRKGDTEETKRLLFAGSTPGEGTTTIATCAAIGLARHLLKQVLLVETNFYSPSMAATLELEPDPGFTDLLRGDAGLDEVIRPTGIPSLRLIPAGSSEAIGFHGSALLQQTLELLSRHCEFLVIDAPPLLDYPESRLLLPFVNEAILVTCAQKTNQADVKKSVRIIENSGVEFVGAVLNQYRREAPAWLVPE